MAIYDKNGSVLTSVYSYNGARLSRAYDINGTSVYGNNYSIDNVVSYMQTETINVSDQINALDSSWVSFVYITDIHNDANENNSQAVANYLLHNSKVMGLFLGGDYCAGDWNATYYSEWMESILEYSQEQTYPVLGNHERFGVPSLSTLVPYIHDDFLADKSFLNGEPQLFYYYFDNSSKKIRYMVINTSETSGNGVSDTQIRWITRNVSLPSTDWKLVVFGHHDIDVTNFTEDYKSTKSAEITSAISSCNGYIVGYFCGHEHLDQLRLVNNKFYQLISNCDRFETGDSWGVPRPSRTRGTSTEQVVTVVSFNISTGDVVTRRIGAGAGLTANEFSWNYKTLA